MGAEPPELRTVRGMGNQLWGARRFWNVTPGRESASPGDAELGRESSAREPAYSDPETPEPRRQSREAERSRRLHRGLQQARPTGLGG